MPEWTRCPPLNLLRHDSVSLSICKESGHRNWAKFCFVLGESLWKAQKSKRRVDLRTPLTDHMNHVVNERLGREGSINVCILGNQKTQPQPKSSPSHPASTVSSTSVAVDQGFSSTAAERIVLRVRTSLRTMQRLETSANQMSSVQNLCCLMIIV